jgi:hypothetical protein
MFEQPHFKNIRLKTGAPKITIVFEVAGQPEYVSLSQAVRQLKPGVRQVAANELVLRIHLHQPDMHYAWMKRHHSFRIKKLNREERRCKEKVEQADAQKRKSNTGTQEKDNHYKAFKTKMAKENAGIQLVE